MITLKGKDVSERLELTVSCATNKGSRRLNEDNYLALVGEAAPCGTLGLVAVADGIGGLGTGAWASTLALKMLADVFSASCTIASSTKSDIPHLLRYSLQKANAAVFQAQMDDKDLHGMGTTCVAAAVTKDAIHVVSIGDSRAYILRDGKLIPLTEDEWIKQADGVTVVNRAVGWQPILPTDPTSHELQPGDQIVLCTDGLTDALPEDVIVKTLCTAEGDACVTLTQSAADCEKSDNVTVVIAKVV
jgi:protein phosphatase